MIYAEQKQNNYIHINCGRFEVLEVNKKEKGTNVKFAIKNRALELFAVANFYFTDNIEEGFFEKIEKNQNFENCIIFVQGSKFVKEDTGEVVHYNRASLTNLETETFSIIDGAFYKKNTYEV